MFVEYFYTHNITQFHCTNKEAEIIINGLVLNVQLMQCLLKRKRNIPLNKYPALVFFGIMTNGLLIETIIILYYTVIWSNQMPKMFSETLIYMQLIQHQGPACSITDRYECFLNLLLTKTFSICSCYSLANPFKELSMSLPHALRPAVPF